VVVLIIITLYQVLCMLQLILDLHLELIVIHELLVHRVHLRMHLFRWIKWDEVGWAIVIPFFCPVWSSVKRWRHNIFVSDAG
jgi:hypothetical protein